MGGSNIAVDKYHGVVLRPLEMIRAQILEVEADRLEKL